MLWPGILLVVWMVVAFVFPYLALPFVRREPLPSRFPRDLEEACEQLSNASATPYEFIKESTDYLLSQHRPSRVSALFFWREAFEADMRVLLRRRGFLHSNHLSHLMRVLMSKSQFFSDSDIRLRYTILNFRLHHYLQVKVAGQWFDVDVAGVAWGVSLGRHAQFFA